MKKRGWGASLTALVSFAVSVANAGTNTWTESGPDVVAAFVRYSGNSSVVYARGGDKLWRSSDSGATWVVKNSGNTREYAFAVNPGNANIVVMQDPYYALQRSIDGGNTFNYAAYSSSRLLKYGGATHRLYDVSYNTPYVRYSDDNGSTWTNTTDNGLPPPPPPGNPIPAPFDIAIHPLDPNILYVAYRDAAYSGVYKTINGGASWTAGPGLVGVLVNAVAIDPGTPARVFAASDTGLYVSQDSGASWALVPDPNATGVANRPLLSLAFDPLDPTVLYAGGAQRGELFRGTNSGTTWQRRDTGIVASRIMSIAPRPGSSDELLLGTSHTIYRSTNAGQNWSNSANGTRSFFVSALHNGSRLRVALTDAIYESLDGNTWTPLNNLALRDSHRNGIFAQVRGIADPGRLFVMFNDGDLVASSDGGNTWQRPLTFNYLHNGLAGGFVTESGSGPVHYATSYSGVDKSFDDGLTWFLQTNGLPNPPLTTKLVKNANASALYVGTFNQGMYKSTNGGSTWVAINNGLTDPNSRVIRNLAYDEANDAIVVGSNDGVYVSRNGGTSFTAVSSPTPGTQASIGAMLVEDFDHGAIYIGVVGSVYRSVDQGATWTELSAGAAPPSTFNYVQDIMGDGPGVIYAGYSTGLGAFTVSPDIRLTTTAPAAGTYAIGAQIPWSVTVTNNGPLASTFSNFTWPLPGNVEVSNVSTSKGTCQVSSSRVLSCDLGVMQAAQTATINLTITGIAGGTVNIDASAGSAEIDSQPNNNRFVNSGVHFVEQVDMAVTLDAADTVDSGASVEYTLTVRNNGPDAVTGASFETGFDPRDQYVLNQGSIAGCTGSAAGLLTCPLSRMASGEARVWRWAVTPIPAGPRNPSAAARLSADNSQDNNTANNSDTEPLTVVAVNDMRLTLQSSRVAVNRGQQVSYTLIAANLGVIAAPGVTASLTLPAALQYSSSTGSCSVSGTVVTCDLGGLDAGASGTVTVTLNALTAGTSNVSALAASANPDRNAANNTASASLDVAAVGNLGVTLASSVAAVETNVAFTYTLTVSNAAGSDAASAIARVTLSNLLSYTSAAGATCVLNAGVVSCNVGPLAAGASGTVTLNVSGASAGSATSSAEVVSSIVESDPTNNSVNATAVTISNPPPPPPPPPPAGGGGGGSGGGGGGGAFDYASALLLAGILGLLTRRRRAWAISRTRTSPAVR